MNFEIPVGLTDLLQDFTVSVLKERPPDLVKFAADYFANLNNKKQTEKEDGKNKPRGIRFAASPPPSEPMEEDVDSDDEPMGKAK